MERRFDQRVALEGLRALRLHDGPPAGRRSDTGEHPYHGDDRHDRRDQALLHRTPLFLWVPKPARTSRATTVFGSAARMGGALARSLPMVATLPRLLRDAPGCYPEDRGGGGLSRMRVVARVARGATPRASRRRRRGGCSRCR